jgi:hypothetical protein
MDERVKRARALKLLAEASERPDFDKATIDRMKGQFRDRFTDMTGEGNKLLEPSKGAVPENVRIKGVGTDKIDTGIQRTISGQDRLKKIAKLQALKKAAKPLKAVPIIGPAIGALAALSSGDAAAAIPILNEADATGPAKGSPEAAVEDPTLSREERQKILEKLMKRDMGE